VKRSNVTHGIVVAVNGQCPAHAVLFQVHFQSCGYCTGKENQLPILLYEADGEGDGFSVRGFPDLIFFQWIIR
jgi:predicted  nucleic acid-binding Zn ribbon protein